MALNKAKETKIFLVEANHATRGITTNTVPIALAMISRYLVNTVEHPFSFKMAKTIPAALDILEEGWMPDVLAISQYHWCSQASLYIAGVVKKRYPDCIIIAGGPNLPRNPNRRIAFLQANPSVDLCVELEGEIPFSTIIKRLLAGESVRDIQAAPSAGVFAIHPETGCLNYAGDCSPRLSSIDLVGAMYVEGFLDEMLEKGFHPFIQTQRGCVFTCAFCHASDNYYSKVRLLSPHVFRKDIEYLGARFAGKHNIPLYIGLTNFGLYKQDMEIALVIRQMQDKYDWPRQVICSTVRYPEKIKALNKVLKYKVPEKIALQTVTPNVLKNINRKNIPFKEFIDFQSYAIQRGEDTSTELILNLPGETKQSFLDGLEKVLDSGVRNITIYTLMKLEGTPIGSDEFAQRYAYVTRYRLVPRDFTEINHTKIFETDEVIVATDTMSQDDYYELRGYAFTVSSYFSSVEFLELRRLLHECGVPISRWVFNVHARLSQTPGVAEVYQGFMRETKDELFPTRKSLIDYYSQPENYTKLLAGEIGDNVVRKYKFQLLSRHYLAALELAVTEAKKLLSPVLGEHQAKVMLGDIQTFLSTRDLSQVIVGNNIEEAEFKLTYDVLHWINKERESNGKEYLPLKELEGNHLYKVRFSDHSKKMIKQYQKQNRDSELSLQIFYRDGLSKDCWPEWVRQ